MANISVERGTLVVERERQEVVETIAAVNENNVSVKRGTLVMKRVGEMVDVIQGGLQAMEQPQPTSEDPDRQFYQSGVPINQRVFEPEEKPMTMESTTDQPIPEKPDVEVKELPDATKSDVAVEVRPTDGKVDNELNFWTKNYADVYLRKHEGIKPHRSIEGGKDTAAFGIKFDLGLKREDYSSDAEFAAAVSLKHRDLSKNKIGSDRFDSLPIEVQFAITDLHLNVGDIGQTPSKTSTEDMMKNTLEFNISSVEDGGKGSLVSLSERRAYNWNQWASKTEGVPEITKVTQVKTVSGGSKTSYLDAQGNEVHSMTSPLPPIKILKKDNKFITQVLETNEVNL